MIVHVIKSNNFSIISNAVLQNQELSWEARGLAAYLLSLPDTWRVREEHLIHAAPNGRTAVRRTMKELQTEGYLHRRRYQDAKGQWHHDVFLLEMPHRCACHCPKCRNYHADDDAPLFAPPPVQNEPTDSLPTAEKPTDRFPTVGKPAVEENTQNKHLKEKGVVVVGVTQPPQTEGRFPSSHAATDDAADDAANSPSLAAPNADLPATTTETTTTTTTNDDTSSAPELPPAIVQEWLDTFGELTTKQEEFLTNRIKGDGADLVLRAIKTTQLNIEAGSTVTFPSGYVRTILTNFNNTIGAGRPLPEPKATGHRGYNPRQGRSQRSAAPAPIDDEQPAGAGAEPIDQVATPVDDEQPADQVATPVDDRRAAQQQQMREQLAAAAEQERIEREKAAIVREHQREADRAAAAERTRQEIANRISGAIEAPDQAERLAADFLNATPDQHMRNMCLDMLTMKRNQAGKPLTTAEATAILHRRLLATPAAAQNRVTA